MSWPGGADRQRAVAKAKEKDLFLRIVQKRRQGHYRTTYYLEPLITGRSTSSSCCAYKSVIKDINDSPLPAPIQQQLDEVAHAHRMRKRGGEYPFVTFARRLLNALWRGEGKASISIETIHAFMGRKPNYGDFHQQLAYKRLLVEHGLIEGDWERFIKRHERSALYRMTKHTMEVFVENGRRTGRWGEKFDSKLLPGFPVGATSSNC